MKRILQVLILQLLFVFSTGNAKDITLTILHTTDLHAHVLPTTDYDGNQNVGGIARCAWMIKKIRKEEKNVLLVDAGDLYQGSALGYLTKGAAMIRSINSLNYTAWTPGNHEFDWGIDQVAGRFSESQVPIIAANLHYQPNKIRNIEGSHAAINIPQLKAAFQKIQPYIILNIEGVKIGIVGLDTPGIPNWSRPRLIPGITLEDSISALKRVIPEMKAAGCNILVLVTHQGIREWGDDHANQINAITKSFPELDLIIGGHSHKLYKAQSVNGVLYTQASYWGTYLGHTKLTYDTVQSKLISKKTDAISMDAKVPMDTELLAMLKPDLDRTHSMLQTQVGETKDFLSSLTAPKKETSVFNLLCAAIAEAVASRGGKIDAVLHGSFNERVAIQPGPITMQTIFDIIPYENTIGVAYLSRDQLLEILEENASAYSSSRFRGLWGLMTKLKPSAPKGQRVIFVGDSQGKALEANAHAWVAFNSFDLASGGMHWPKLRAIVDQPAAQLIEYDFQTREALVEYLEKFSPVHSESHGWWSVGRGKQEGNARGSKLEDLEKSENRY